MWDAHAELRQDLTSALNAAYRAQNLTAVVDLLRIKTAFVVALLETQPIPFAMTALVPPKTLNAEPITRS